MNKNIDLQALLDAFPDEFLHLTPIEQKIALSLYRLLEQGNAVTIEQLAQASTLPEKDVVDMLSKSDGVYYDKDKNIIGFWGLSVEPMRHKFKVDGRELYAWCAWDTLFLPGILGKTAEVCSKCPVSEEDIYLKVSPTGILEVRPASVVVSFVMPDPAGIKKDVVSSFCQSVCFFKSEKESETWVKEHPGTFTMSLSMALDLAKMKNQQKFLIDN